MELVESWIPWEGMDAVIIIHAGAAVFMAGALWYIQLIHYPRLAAVPPGKLALRATANILRTSVILGPVMAVELATAAALVVYPRSPAWPAYAGALLLGQAWASTLMVQYPIHRRLADGGDPAEVGRLLWTNWFRVALWSARAWLAVRMAL